MIQVPPAGGGVSLRRCAWISRPLAIFFGPPRPGRARHVAGLREHPVADVAFRHQPDFDGHSAEHEARSVLLGTRRCS